MASFGRICSGIIALLERYLLLKILLLSFNRSGEPYLHGLMEGIHEWVKSPIKDAGLFGLTEQYGYRHCFETPPAVERKGSGYLC